MAKQGWIKIHRSLFDHWIFNHGEKSYGEAWVDLLLMVNHKDNKVCIRSKLIDVKKGSTLTSILKLSQRWKRSRRWASSLLNNLEKDGMITQIRNSSFSMITVCNYSIFQSEIEEVGQPKAQRKHNESTAKAQPEAHEQECKEGKECKEYLKTHVIVEKKNSKWGAEIREVFEHWVKVMGKDPKRAKLNQKRKRLVEARLKEGYDVEVLKLAIDGLEKTDWNMGRHPNNQKRYDDFQYFCKDGERVETMAERGSGLEETKNDYSQHRAEKTAAFIANALNFDGVKNEENRRISDNVLTTVAIDSRCDGENSNE